MRASLAAVALTALTAGTPAHAAENADGACHNTRGPSVTHTWVLVAAGWATSTEDVALTTAVSCTLTDVNGDALTVEATSLGAAAAASGARPMNVASLASKCVVVTVQYLMAGETTWSRCTYY